MVLKDEQATFEIVRGRHVYFAESQGAASNDQPGVFIPWEDIDELTTVMQMYDNLKNSLNQAKFLCCHTQDGKPLIISKDPTLIYLRPYKQQELF